MALFEQWCDSERVESKRKRLWKFAEKQGGRDSIRAELFTTVRSHYDNLDRIADDVKELGYELTAVILRERLPQTKKARSGELGEILATELIEEELAFDVPVRRLRYKDGREMALRGDDFIGVRYSPEEGLQLLKGESKSRAVLNKTTVTEARTVLNRDSGRCTPMSLLFVADRLLERTGEKENLGRVLRKEVGTKSLPARRIDHVLFTMSGNAAIEALDEDLQQADSARNQTVINIRIDDHQDFIVEVYEGAQNLGND